METVNALGRRKEAVARVYVNEGAGKIVINGRDIETYFPSSILRYIVLQPLTKLGVAGRWLQRPGRGTSPCYRSRTGENQSGRQSCSEG